jgi:hypothetical protein
MTVVRALLLGGLLLASAEARAQTVLGTVVEDDTRAQIAGALVELLTTDGGALARVRTDSSGLFLLRAPQPGRIVLRVTHASYATVESDTLTLARDESVELEIRMDQDAIPLEPLVVTARRAGRLAGYYERLERPGFARFVTRSQIERRPGAQTTDLLRDLPGVTIRRIRTSTGTGDNMITMRLGQCLPVVYIDGIQVPQVQGGGMDVLLRPEMIEGVEVYTGAAGVPTQFASDGCGVVAFWTRTGEDGAQNGWSWRRILAGAAALTFLGALVAATR